VIVAESYYVLLQNYNLEKLLQSLMKYSEKLGLMYAKEFFCVLKSNQIDSEINNTFEHFSDKKLKNPPLYYWVN